MKACFLKSRQWKTATVSFTFAAMILLTFTIPAGGATPMRSSGSHSALSSPNVSLEQTSPGETSNSCAANLSPSEKLKYRATGYVSSALLEKFSYKHPMLFTPLYFRALGIALNAEGFHRISNTKGLFFRAGKAEEKEVIDAVSGTAQASVQRQGSIATRIYDLMSEALLVKEGNNVNESVIESAAKAAGFTSLDAFLSTREALVVNQDRKAEIIEFIRISLLFGVKMGIDNVGKSGGTAVVITSLVTAGTTAVAYVAAQLGLMLNIPDPGDLPFFISLGTATAVGISTYLFTAPNTHLNRMRVWMMNRHNRKILKKKGLIGDGRESTGLIEGSFQDFTEARRLIDKEEIDALVPELPLSADPAEIESKLFRYASKVSGAVPKLSTFLAEIGTQWTLRKESLGDPLKTMLRILEPSDKTVTRYPVPNNAHTVLSNMISDSESIYEKVIEAEAEGNSLVGQFENHISQLENWEKENRAILTPEIQASVTRNIVSLNGGIGVILTLLKVVKANKENLEIEKLTLTSALQSLVVAESTSAFDAMQLASFRADLTKLLRILEESNNSQVADQAVKPGESQ